MSVQKTFLPISGWSGSPVVVAAGLFVIALLPRVFGLGLFITSDEPLWMTRSVLFSEALLSGNPAGTLQTGHPGVTTMWTGSLGLWLGYLKQDSAAAFPDFIRGLPHRPDRVDASLLPLVRLPTVVLAALCVSLLFLWGRRLVGRQTALIAALLLAFDPLFLAHSRVLHHDALATIFISLSVVLLFNYAAVRQSGAGAYLAGSGVLAGLALLSKGTSLALVLFAGLFLAWLWLGQKRPLRGIVAAGLVWLGLAAGVFILFWPAMWVTPGQVLGQVFGWVLASADVGDVVETTSFNWAGRMPNLGILFYPANWLLKSTPLTLIGLAGLVGWWRVPRNRNRRGVGVWLVIFTALFAVLLTVGDKRDGRYLLPVYPGLCLLAAAGLEWVGQRLVGLQPLRLHPVWAKSGLAVLFGLLLAGFSLPWYPYYHSYYNPLIGGSRLAPRLVKVGWGEGMEQVAAYLNRQPDARWLVVATSYASTLLPFFEGEAVKHHQPAPSDYVLNYVRQVQNGYPFPEYWEYYRPRPPLFTVRQDGLDYAWLYPGPHITIVRNAEFTGGLTLLGFVGEQDALQPGRPQTITLLWRAPANTNVDGQTARLHLQTGEGHIWAKASGPVLDPAGPSPVEGHYRLDIPPDMPRGEYQLWVSIGQESHLAGQIPVRHLDRPPVQIPARANFGNLITFGGATVSEFLPAGSGGLAANIRLIWQARRPIPRPYTTFVHLVDESGQIWGQADRQPGDGRWPTNTWDKGEWIIDEFQLLLKSGAPAGAYTLLVGVYDSQTFERLPVTGQNNGRTVVELTTLTVPGTEGAP